MRVERLSYQNPGGLGAQAMTPADEQAWLSAIGPDRGVFVFSVDVELLWGFHDIGPARHRSYAARERDAIRGLLDVLAKHDVPATFATVGHVFLERCGPRGARPHPELSRPSYPWVDGDWYAEDPCSDAASDPLWYGPDIVAEIARARPTHEIASHSFSHVLFGEAGCDAQVARDELAAFAAASYGSPPARSFVFPRNSVGHLDALAAHGYWCYRGPDPWWFKRLPGGIARRAAHFADALFAMTPPVARARRTSEGLWDIPGSMLLLGREGPRRLIPRQSRVRKAARGLDAAVRDGAIFHLWCHPWNLATDPPAMLDTLDGILEEVAWRREARKLAVHTMGSLAAELRVARVAA